jgi:glucosamine 6-phosphate synthetase-like amidotransferase/phosphosugar isomerase protein
VHEGLDLGKQDLQRVKYAGYLSLSQSGQSESLIKGVQEAIALGITCMNVVNVEDSPLTRVISENSAQDSQSWFDSENIGMYMKSGFCYSDAKSFIPEVISMALVALWFSAHKSANHDKEIKLKRQQLIREITALPARFSHLLQNAQLSI